MFLLLIINSSIRMPNMSPQHHVTSPTLRFLNTIPERLINVPDNTVSAVVCIHSLCSSHNPNLALLEILRVLKPGGKVSSMLLYHWLSCYHVMCHDVLKTVSFMTKLITTFLLHKFDFSSSDVLYGTCDYWEEVQFILVWSNELCFTGTVYSVHFSTLTYFS